MKLFSVELLTAGVNKTAKAVVLRKNRAGYTLLNHYITEPDNLKALSGQLGYYFCIDYYDTIIETVNVPAVKDSKTFKMLAKNKMKEHLDDEVSYLMAYKQNDYASTAKSGNVEHNVYMVPESLFEKDSELSEEQKLKMSMFTISDFALCGVSDYFFPEEMIFHAFADESKVTMTVSKGKTVVYTRAMEYLYKEDTSIESVYYESINLTYMFVSKNLRINIDRMILSGMLSDKSDLSNMLFTFNSKPQSVVLPSTLLDNCSSQTFSQFMIPISLCLLDDSYDFTPDKYKEARGFNLLKTIVNSVAMFTLLILLFMNVTWLDKLSFAKEKFNAENNVIKLKLERNIYNFQDSDLRRYGFYYIKQLEKHAESSFDMYADTAGLIDTGDYDNVRFTSDQDVPTLTISGDSKFKTFKEIDMHRQEVEKWLTQLQASGKYKITNTSKFDMEKLISDIKLKIEKVK